MTVTSLSRLCEQAVRVAVGVGDSIGDEIVSILENAGASSLLVSVTPGTVTASKGVAVDF